MMNRDATEKELEFLVSGKLVSAQCTVDEDGLVPIEETVVDAGGKTWTLRGRGTPPPAAKLGTPKIRITCGPVQVPQSMLDELTAAANRARSNLAAMGRESVVPFLDSASSANRAMMNEYFRAIETTTTKIHVEPRVRHDPTVTNYAMIPQSAPVAAVQAPAVPTHPDPSMFATASGALLDALCWVVGENRREAEADWTYRDRGMFAASRKIVDHVIAGDSGRHCKARAGALRAMVGDSGTCSMASAHAAMNGLKAYEAALDKGMRPARACQEADRGCGWQKGTAIDAYNRYRAQGL